uniref:LSU ribosomal protein L32e n=1 Tax=uncultured euryarchaeote Rifle_16ft_4_minimus_25120 TaxID=1665191 RepID=A0A0H4T2A4_9EURY|nr:LSU ribosomal protein L32e [uncultured euryarchaeote Rifle_16ft_4_minimus_25120]
MADDSTKKTEKKAKKAAMPDVPPETEEAKTLPSAHEIREAKKAQLVAWAEEFGLSTEGKVDELRKRLVKYTEKQAKEEAPPKEAPPPKPEAKPAKKERKAAKPKEAEEEAEYEPKAKPKLDPRMKKLLALWNIPSIGYRGPREVRGLHPSGFQEVLVHTVRQLEGLDPARQAVRVAHGVGTRKRELIEKACDEKDLRVLNRMVTE